MIFEFNLPELGEGLVEGELVRWHVREGDAVAESQVLATVLTDKAEVEIPSPKGGTVVKLAAKPGDRIQVHGPFVTLGAADGGVKTTAMSSPATIVAGGDDERVPFAGIRRRTAEKMSQSWRTVAAVSHMEEADVTALAALRSELQGEARKLGVKLTYLPFVIRALVKSLKEFPLLNAALDEAGGALVLKRYYNIGVATAAEQGLLVPVVKEADKKDLWGLAAEIQRLADKARAGKAEPADLSGGTFTVTNIGAIGGLYASPIVNHPEVGILAVMQARERPVVRNGAVVARSILNLVLSFDHRVLDGAEAARFMVTLVKRLENPRTLL